MDRKRNATTIWMHHIENARLGEGGGKRGGRQECNGGQPMAVGRGMGNVRQPERLLPGGGGRGAETRSGVLGLIHIHTPAHIHTHARAHYIYMSDKSGRILLLNHSDEEARDAPRNAVAWGPCRPTKECKTAVGESLS